MLIFNGSTSGIRSLPWSAPTPRGVHYGNDQQGFRVLDGGAFAYGVVAPQSQFAVGSASRMAWVVANLHMFPAIGAGLEDCASGEPSWARETPDPGGVGSTIRLSGAGSG